MRYADGQVNHIGNQCRSLRQLASQFGQNQKAMAKEKEDLRVLIEHFDADQMDRYEAYRRSGLNKGAVRRVSERAWSHTRSHSIR